MSSRIDIRTQQGKNVTKEAKDYLQEALAISRKSNIKPLEHEQIISLLKQATELKANCEDSYFLLGQSYVALKQYNCAAFNFTMCIRINGNSGRAYAMRGLCNRKLGRINDALQDYNDAIKKDPSGENYMSRAVVLHDLGNYQAAVADFKLALSAENKPKHVHKVHYHLGKCFRYLGQISASVEQLRLATTTAAGGSHSHGADSVVPEAHNQLGISLCEELNFAAARIEFSHAIDLRQDVPAFYNNRALALFHLGNFRAALDDLTRALECCDAYDAHIMQSSAWGTGNNNNTLTSTSFNGGLGGADRSNALSTAYPPSAQVLGGDSNLAIGSSANLSAASKAHAAQRQRQTHIIDAPSATSGRDPEEGTAGPGPGASVDKKISTRIRAVYHFHRGNCYNALGEFDHALNDYEVACQLVPSHAEFYHHRGLTLAQMRRWEDAVAAFARAIQLDPHHFAAHFHQGCALHKLGHLEQALEALLRVPDDKVVMCERGKVRRDLQRLEEAVDDFTVALEDDPSNKEFRSLRGHVYLMLGDGKAALLDFSLAISHALNEQSPGMTILATRPNGALDVPPQRTIEAADGTAPTNNNDGKPAANNNNTTSNGPFARTAAGASKMLTPEQEEEQRLTNNLRAIHGAIEKMTPVEREHLATLCHGRGLGWAFVNHTSKAEMDLSQAIALHPSNAVFKISRAMLFAGQGAYERALFDINAALKSVEAQAKLKAKQLAQQQQQMMMAASQNMDDGRASGALINNMDRTQEVYMMSTHNLNASSFSPSKAIAAGTALPQQQQNINNGGLTTMMSGQEGLAGNDPSSQIDQTSTSLGHLLYLRACIKLAMHRERDAIEDFQSALQAGPRASRTADLYYRLGVALATIGRHAQAAAAFDKAVQAASQFGWRGFECPLVVTREYRLMDVSRRPGVPPHYLHERAKALQCAGHHVAAVTDFSEVIRRQKWNARALFRRAFSYKALGMLEEAAEDLETAKEIDPRDPRLAVNYRKLHNIVAITLAPPGMEDRTDTAAANANAAANGIGQQQQTIDDWGKTNPQSPYSREPIVPSERGVSPAHSLAPSPNHAPPSFYAPIPGAVSAAPSPASRLGLGTPSKGLSGQLGGSFNNNNGYKANVNSPLRGGAGLYPSPSRGALASAGQTMSATGGAGIVTNLMSR